MIRRDSGRLIPNSDINYSTSSTDREHSLLQSSLHACSVEGYSSADPVTDFVDPRSNVVFCGVEDVVGAELLCEGFASGGDFGDYYFPCFSRFENLDQLGKSVSRGNSSGDEKDFR